MDDAAKLEAELAELTKERVRKADEREESSRAKRAQAEIARNRRLMEMDEVYAGLEDEHGRGYIRRINLRDGGMVVVRAAEPIVARRFADESSRADHANPKIRTSLHDAAFKMARLCVIFPTLVKFDELCDRRENSGLVTVAANEAYDLSRPQIEEDAAK